MTKIILFKYSIKEIFQKLILAIDYFKLVSSILVSELSESSRLLVGNVQSLLAIGCFPIGFIDFRASSGLGLGAVPPYILGI